MYSLGRQFLFNMNRSKANPASIFKGTNYRITVLTERLIRIEYNRTGLFVDAPTQLVLCRNFNLPKIDVNQDNKYLEITSKYFKLTYVKENIVNSGNLKIYLNNTDSVWYYNHPEVRTYDGLINSLDDNKRFDKGLYSSEGFTSINDSNSLILDINGNFLKRPSEGVDIYVFMYGDDFSLALKDYFALTGNPPLIPRYALGNWWSKDYNYSDEKLIKLINRFDKENIPVSILLLDKYWHIMNKKNTTGYTFEKRLIKDPKDFIDKIHNSGIRVGININPIGGIYSYEEMYPKVLEYIKIENNKTIAFAPFNPSFIDIFLKLLLHPLEKTGVDFFWLDYNNDSLSKYILNHYMFLDNGREEEKRSMILSRNVNIAAHRYGILYSGRTNVGFNTLKSLPYINISAANIGVSWWSHDIGGFTGGIEDGELFLRYVQFGCFSPIFRISSDYGKYYKREPWNWDIKTFEIVKYYMNLRHKLVPYIYSEAYKYSDAGIPIVNPLYYKSKELYYNPLYKNEYYFGSELLVSPLTDKKDMLMNRVVHKFYLPEGIWYDFKNGKKFPGGRSYVSFFKDEDYPVFAKSGAIIPIDMNVTNSLVIPENLEIDIFPGCSNSYQLYEDDGVTNLYKSGYFLKTLIDYNYQASNYTVIIRAIDGKSGIVGKTRNYK